MTTGTSLQDHIRHAKQLMDKAVEAVKREFSTVRTGRATTALLDLVKVEAYGSEMPLNQVGTVAAPEPKLLTVQPWDKSLLKAITRAIQLAELGLNPTDDGTVVRVPIPTLTEERRRDMVKLISKFAEEGRVHIRQVRHDVLKDLKAKEGDGDVSEDEAKRLAADVQKLTDRYIALVDELLKKKTAEVMEV